MLQTEKEYAEALFMLAVEQDETDSYDRALSVVSDCTDAAYWEFLDSPALPLAERLCAVDEAFGTLPEHVVSFIKVLCENGRIRTLPSCIDEFHKLVRMYRNRATAVITSAAPLTEAQQQALCRKLGAVTGKTIDPVYRVDDTLIGGVTVDVEGKTYDGSLKHRLQDMKDVILG